MKKTLITFSIALVTTIFTSCGTTKGVESIDELSAVTWQLTTINGHKVNTADYAKGVPVITFTKDNKVTGNGGCNGFGGSYNLNDEGGVNLSQLMSTKMFCEGGGENEFMAALNKVNMSKIDKDKLVLLQGVEEVMTFVPKK